MSQAVPANITGLLVNPGFDVEPITFTESNGTANGTALVATRIYDVPGWNEELVSAWGRIATANYGITFDAIPDVLNGTTPPATDMAGSTEGAALKLSGSWGSPAVVTQDVTLPAGNYELSFEVINMSAGLSIGINQFGFVPNEGDAVYGTTTLFEDVWTTETVAFSLDAETAGKLSIGFEGVGAGTGSNGKLYIDNVNLVYFGVPSDVAELSNLTVNDVDVDGFAAGTYVYDVVLPVGTVDIPTVTATPADGNATVVIADAEALPGATTVTVTAEDGTTELTYTLNFTVEVGTSLNAIGMDDVQVYPTVSNGRFTVDTNGQESKLTVLDMTGRVISVHETIVDEAVSIAKPGIYLLKVERNGVSKVFKVVKKN
ncbi:hypothetical protein JCM15548_11069 [Geofilum rubicundum JCM 15548]|uniref:Uncharacterized protein n=1 Tax=Geofilum rubicundum JCM 15548 TaxID=1236989 RepID=A0A0E9LVP7_9BACT|nr:hypothetical protein JCM15548_11069 [Geofilum rubicundum JCM 15548]